MNCTEEENAMEATPICQAWLRPDGGKGIRNKVLVLYTVECSKHVAESIAAHFQAQHRDVDVTGSLACLDNQAVVQRMLAYCVHPNVGAVLIVGHGCDISSRTASATSRGPTAARQRRFTCRRSAARRRASRSAAGSSARCWKRSMQAPVRRCMRRS